MLKDYFWVRFFPVGPNDLFPSLHFKTDGE
ncbi:hypothetical protein P872_12475 [Rhodonellum psychrophilum GCM71 = DSM 17998]|uniref:Uncharacterized protein n=1 Tax=Rhodonellum psychrophilum GCM71 = DSM 17998 TaxID=1123057 RepID=U5BT15_9BACT|nr:hypothetical protein P872_12475 [Rhodonellum psychrophilum GCM71 = DSM 17998]